MALRVTTSGPGRDAEDLIRRLEQAQVRAMGEAQLLLVREARGRVRVKTGTLRRSITAEKITVENGVIRGAVGAGGQGAPYAEAQDSGSGLYGPRGAKYPILPKTPGGVLAWPQGGVATRLSGAISAKVRQQLASGKLKAGQVFTFARSVQHPGVKPTRFLTGAAEDLWPAIQELHHKAVRSVLGGD